MKRRIFICLKDDKDSFNDILKSKGFGSNTFSVELEEEGVLSAYACDWNMSDENYIIVKDILGSKVTEFDEGTLKERRISRKGLNRVLSSENYSLKKLSM